jgi:hypothetical protein
MAFISTPENPVDHYKEVSRRLALSRGVSDAEARKLAHDQKAIIHIDGGLHNRGLNAQHTIQSSATIWSRAKNRNTSASVM